MSKHSANSSIERKSANRKIVAIGIIAVLMASMVAIALQEIQPAFAQENKTTKHAKGDKREANQQTLLKKLRGSTFILTGSGEAKQRDANHTAKVSTKLGLSIFRATPHMVLLKVTNGTITIGGVTYTAEHGKAVVAMKAHKMILTTQVSSGNGTKTLRLFGSGVNSPSDNTDVQAMNMHAMQIKGKLAQWSIEMQADLDKTG